MGKLINKPNINKPEPGKQLYRDVQESVYTTNWTATLALFNELKALGKGDAATYTKAHDMALDWLKKYPAKNNKWGPFFEDILGWSDCQINAITYAMYLMDNERVDPDWKNTVKNIFQWVRTALDDKEFEKYGVITTDEQTIYRTPGNSHSSRQASMELRYWEKTGDTTRLTNAIRQLNWATYMVNTDGRNYYIRDDIWLTDGYGDYVRHYIRAMAAAPQLAHEKGDHLLRTSSVVSAINYNDAVSCIPLLMLLPRNVFMYRQSRRKFLLTAPTWEKLRIAGRQAIPGSPSAGRVQACFRLIKTAGKLKLSDNTK